MDTQTLPKYQAAEANGNKKPRNLPGVYRHEAAGKEVITVADPNDGSIQADALVRVGYHRIGDVPSRVELAKRREAQLKKDEAAEKSGTPTVEDAPAGVILNGTTTQSAAELKEAKEKAETELAETKATLAALQAGLKKEKK